MPRDAKEIGIGNRSVNYEENIKLEQEHHQIRADEAVKAPVTPEDQEIEMNPDPELEPSAELPAKNLSARALKRSLETEEEALGTGNESEMQNLPPKPKKEAANSDSTPFDVPPEPQIRKQPDDHHRIARSAQFRPIVPKFLNRSSWSSETVHFIGLPAQSTGQPDGALDRSFGFLPVFSQAESSDDDFEVGQASIVPVEPELTILASDTKNANALSMEEMMTPKVLESRTRNPIGVRSLNLTIPSFGLDGNRVSLGEHFRIFISADNNSIRFHAQAVEQVRPLQPPVNVVRIADPNVGVLNFPIPYSGDPTSPASSEGENLDRSPDAKTP